MTEKIQSILILDDEVTIRDSFADYFEDHGWHVLRAASGEEALEVLAVEVTDCVLVDIRLPGMSGDSFIREVHEKYSVPPISLVVTGSSEYCLPRDVAALPRVIEKVFSKPVMNLEELETMLHQKIKYCSKGNIHD
ncbi:MAG: response regulator [Candidatus Hydrogenedentes bacterium]|nr:response regulator [Candidatus Hydrogenedentota bacterium]